LREKDYGLRVWLVAPADATIESASVAQLDRLQNVTSASLAPGICTAKVCQMATRQEKFMIFLSHDHGANRSTTQLPDLSRR